MKGIIRKIGSYNEMSNIVALHVKRFIGNSQLGVLGLPTGGTPLGMYEELRNDNRLDWRKVVTFNLDEYVGIDKNHPESYKNYMYRNLFSHVDIYEDRVHFPDGEHYDSRIIYFGGLDFTVLGIGNNGHIAFNEPGSPRDSLTRKVELTENTRKDNSRFFDIIDDVPTHAWTMGIESIMRAKQIYLLANGKHKKDILEKACYGDITSDIPASYLQEHNNKYK